MGNVGSRSILRIATHTAAVAGLCALGLTACSGDRDGVDFSDSTAGDPEGPCSSDADCVGNPAGEFCLAEQCGPQCLPGQQQPCYSGPEGTENVGACAAGMQTCSAEGIWEDFCQGEVQPVAEACDNGIDDDCDGSVDDTDRDGDGFGACSADCCDSPADGCDRAELVNPGAYEVVGNNLDDNCDGTIDEAAIECDGGIGSDTSDALDFAFAMDLCHTTDESPSDPAMRTWGVIDADLTLADGSGVPRPEQFAVRPRFGNAIDPQKNNRMAVLSSGHAADKDDSAPAFAPFQAGVDLASTSAAPADWLMANGGAFPNPAGCREPWSADANDPVMLTLRVRVPTNARSFSVMIQFFSAEYPEWVCSEFNDFFVALLDSEADNPADGNIAVYDDGQTLWPVGVNLVNVADGLFTQCQNGPVGCATNQVTTYSGCTDNSLLVGTGFEDTDDGCAPDDQIGGGTGWLRLSGNVTPGEIVDLRFAIWDTSGHIFDSLVLLDGWEWSVDAATPGVVPG